MPEVILPCPDCGDDECLIVIQGLPSEEWSVHCGCGHAGRHCATEEDAIKAHNALPRALTWTHEPPKVAGWYFQRTAGEDQTINVAYVYSGLAGLYCECGCRNTPLKCWIAFEWAGPIAPPVEG